MVRQLIHHWRLSRDGTKRIINQLLHAQRGLVLVDNSDLHKGKPFKKLTKGLTKSGGRNNYGHLTARRKGGGHKRKYRIIDFKRTIIRCSGNR